MVEISGTVRKRGKSFWVVFDDADSKKLRLKEGDKININSITPKKRISAFGKFPFLKSFERDRDREF